jgi:hypothetical protein
METTSHQCCPNCSGVRKIVKLIKNRISVPTIGARRFVRFGFSGNKMFCQAQESNQKHFITTEQIVETCSRYLYLKSLKQKNSRGISLEKNNNQYNQNIWDAPGVNGLIVCPYIAALVALVDDLGDL